MKLCAKAVLLMSLTFVCTQAGEILYASKVKSLYKEGDNKVVGRLLPTAKVDVLEHKGNKVLLRIQGYKQVGSQAALYFAPNRRILNVGFSKNVDVAFKSIETFKESESKQEWELASVDLWSDDAHLVESVEQLYNEAKDLFANCSICHALHPPKEFNANAWPSVIKSMKTRVGFDNDQEYLVSQYLQKNAKDMPKEK
ncbi:heme-binding protein [Helicobacter typhlonius]|uniref:heme-binding protein n=1 Tax=Helicobacter typhlonius TaxID=76936 RepID=UPI002FE3A950